MKQLSAIALAASVALIGAGCSKQPSQPPADVGAQFIAPTSSTASSSESTTSTQTAADATGTEAATTAPRPPARKGSTSTKPTSTVVVQILHGVFSPQVIAATAGDTVVWTNRDSVAHTTHSDGSLIWDTGAIMPGKSASHRFMNVGTYPYSDGNSGIKGTVIIH